MKADSSIKLEVPNFTILVHSSSLNSFFLSFFCSFSDYFLASHSATRMPINRKRRLGFDNEAEKDNNRTTSATFRLRSELRF